MSDVLGRHIDQPTAKPPERHRIIATSASSLLCVDCRHKIEVTTSRTPGSSTAGSTSTSRGIPNVKDPDRCREHPGFWADTCGPCRSERISVPDEAVREPALVESTDPTAVPEWAEARARFGGAR